MPFINEDISNEDKDNLSSELLDEYKKGRQMIGKWTIDRDRDAFLVVVEVNGGGASDSPKRTRFVLCLEGNLINFEADQYRNVVGNSEVTLIWKIRTIDIPGLIRDRKSEIFGLIEEALDARGFLYRRECLSGVVVEFSSVS